MMEEMFGFGEAIKRLKADLRVCREGWNGKGMWIQTHEAYAGSEMSRPYLFIATADGGRVPWVASQTDVLAEDWMMFEE